MKGYHPLIIYLKRIEREEMEKHILKMLRDKDFSIFKVDVDVLYLLKPTVKNTIMVRVYRRIKVNKEETENEEN